MRKLETIQQKEKLNNVLAVDERGAGNANHRYVITDAKKDDDIIAYIELQNGARKEEGSIRGVIDSDLLEIVKDRMSSFQSGAFASEYNAKALNYIELALFWLNRRVEDRIEREVLGKNIK